MNINLPKKTVLLRENYKELKITWKAHDHTM